MVVEDPVRLVHRLLNMLDDTLRQLMKFRGQSSACLIEDCEAAHFRKMAVVDFNWETKSSDITVYAKRIVDETRCRREARRTC